MTNIVENLIDPIVEKFKEQLLGSLMLGELKGQWDIELTKPMALFLVASGIVNDNALGCIMCKEMGQDDDWEGITKDEIEGMYEDDEYQTFTLWK